MTKIGKYAATGAVVLSLATAGLTATPASAHDHGGAAIGIGLGLVTGLIIGDVIANQHRRHVYQPDYSYDNAGYQTYCHPGHLQSRWQEICDPDGYCRNVKTYFRPQVCE